jgi:hypothetical protein
MSNLTLRAVLFNDVSAVLFMIAKYQSYHRGLATFILRSAVPRVVVRLTYGTVLPGGGRTPTCRKKTAHHVRGLD